MFGKAGRGTGNYQWGLDSRHHDDWNPYYPLPAEWKVGNYVGDDEKLEVCDPTIITYSDIHCIY